MRLSGTTKENVMVIPDTGWAPQILLDLAQPRSGMTESAGFGFIGYVISEPRRKLLAMTPTRCFRPLLRVSHRFFCFPHTDNQNPRLGKRRSFQGKAVLGGHLLA